MFHFQTLEILKCRLKRQKNEISENNQENTKYKESIQISGVRDITKGEVETENQKTEITGCYIKASKKRQGVKLPETGDR